MFAAIAAVIGNILGIAKVGVQGANDRTAMQRAEYEQSLAFSQAKDMTYYNAYSSSTKNIAIIAGIGFLFIAVIVFFALRNK